MQRQAFSTERQGEKYGCVRAAGAQFIKVQLLRKTGVTRVQKQGKSGLRNIEFEIEMQSDCIDFCHILCYYFNDDRLLVLEHCKRVWRRIDPIKMCGSEGKAINANIGKTDRHYKKDAQDWRRR